MVFSKKYIFVDCSSLIESFCSFSLAIDRIDWCPPPKKKRYFWADSLIESFWTWRSKCCTWSITDWVTWISQIDHSVSYLPKGWFWNSIKGFFWDRRKSHSGDFADRCTFPGFVSRRISCLLALKLHWIAGRISSDKVRRRLRRFLARIFPGMDRKFPQTFFSPFLKIKKILFLD